MNPDTDTTPDADGGDDLEVEPVGVDEMIRRNRIRSITDARKTCRKKRLDARDLIRESRLKPHNKYRRQGHELYRSALEGYLREVEPLFRKTEEGRQLWENQPFGVIDATPEPREFPGDTNATRQFEEKQIPVEGLNALFEMSPPFTMQFSYVKESAGIGRGMTGDSIQVTRDIPLDILDRMYSETNQYLAELGFGVEFESSDPDEWEI